LIDRANVQAGCGANARVAVKSSAGRVPAFAPKHGLLAHLLAVLAAVLPVFAAFLDQALAGWMSTFLSHNHLRQAQSTTSLQARRKFLRASGDRG
jgi:hypothetical protein